MGEFGRAGTIESHASLVVEALDRLDTIVLVLAPPDPPASLPTVMAANAAFARRVGGKAASGLIEAGGLSRYTLPTSKSTTLTAITQAVEDGTKLSGEVQLAGQGGPFWLGFSLSTVSAPGSATRCVLVGRDITDQVRRSGDDEATQRMLASAFVSVGTPVAIVTAGDRVVTASQRFAHMCGRSTKQMAGNSLTPILDAEVRQRIHAALASSAPGAPAIEFRGGGTHHDGTPFLASFSISVIDGRAGERLAVLTLHQDPPADNTLTPEAPREALSKIRLVGLAEIKEVLGAKWPEVADRAMILAEAAIRRRLGTQDVMSRTTDQEFLIWFQQGNAQTNTILAARIAREVRIVLLTEFADALVSSVASATVTVPHGSPPGRAAAASLAALDRHPALKPDPAVESARAYLAWAEKELPVDIEQLFGRGGQPLPAVWCALPHSVEVRLQDAAAALAGETFGPSERDILRLRVGLGVAAKAAARNLPRSCFVPL